MKHNKNKAIPIPVPAIGGFPGQQVPFDISEAQPKGCLGCGSGLFNLAYRVGKISAMAPMNKTGQDVMIKTETFICLHCGLEIGKEPESKQ